MASRQAGPGRLDVDRHGQPRARHHRPAWLSRAVSDRRDVRLHPDRRSTASARPADAGIRRVADSARPRGPPSRSRAPRSARRLSAPAPSCTGVRPRKTPAAPLSHHTLDSTHIAMGVISVAVDRAPWVFESSVFQSGEPDDNRWDLVDFGALDSWSARVWYKPSDTLGVPGLTWVSRESRTARVRAHPPHDRIGGVAENGHERIYGRDVCDRPERQGVSWDLPRRARRSHATAGPPSVYGRLESVQVETPHPADTRYCSTLTCRWTSDVVTTGTVGGVVELPQWRAVRARRRG